MDRGYTFTEVKTVVMEWKINNFSSHLDGPDASGGSLKSSVFSTGSKVGDQWKLNLYLNLNGSSGNLDGESWIDLGNISSNPITAKVLFFILNSKQEKVLIDKYQHEFLTDEYRGSKIFEDRKFLDNMPEFIFNDILTLYCKISVSENAKTIPHEKLCNLSTNHLAKDLTKLYENKDHSDVTITVNNTEFQAHKSILSVRSPVLAAMFAHDMIEKKSNEVSITDIDPDIFEKVLEYIYTDQVKDLNLVADRVLEAADKYQMQSLKEICEDLLVKSLSPENVIKKVILADRHNAKNLKDYAVKCIIADAASVMKTSEFEQLEKTNPSLAWELLRKIVLAKVDNETTISQTI